MRSKLFIIIFGAVALLLANGEIGSAAEKIPVKAAKPQTAAVKPAQTQTPAIQPEAVNPTPSPSPSSTPVDPFVFEAWKPTANAASPKAGEQINWQVLASGGGTQTVGTLILGSTIGQTVAGSSSAGSYVLQSGFWQNFGGGGGYLCGDPNGTGDLNISDVVYLVAYIFAGGPAPNPMAAGDVDCDGLISIADAVFMIEFIFTHGAVPCASCK